LKKFDYPYINNSLSVTTRRMSLIYTQDFEPKPAGCGAVIQTK